MKIFTYICLYCYLSRWWLLQIGVATLCIGTMTGGSPSNFEMSKLINIARGTRYINPPVTSVIFRKKQSWHDPTSSERRSEDLMTNDFGLGSLEAWSPTFTAHFNSMPETRPWTLMTSSPQLIEPEPWRSYTAHVEGNPHEDHSPTYDSISSSNLDESLGIRLESDLGEPVMEDNCNWQTSCCTIPVNWFPVTWNPDTETYLLDLFFLFENVTIVSVDKLPYDTLQDPRRLGSRFDKLVLAGILVRNYCPYRNTI